MMPVMNGYEATKMIRSLDREDAKIIPIIAMTANAGNEKANRSIYSERMIEEIKKGLSELMMRHDV